MSTWTRVVDPRARPVRSWVLDVLVVVFAVLTGLAPAGGSALGHVLTIAVVAGLALPLLVRRIWPVQVFAAQLTVAAASGWWAQQLVWSFALLIGLYTVAALRPRRDALVAAGLLEIGVVAACLHQGPEFGEWWINVLALTAALVAALAIGLYVGARRFLLAELRGRADRLEVERDQQATIASAAERARIAREMHDIVAHHLTVMVALSEGAVAASAKSPERAVEVMRTVSATGRQALADTRRLLGVLRDDTTGDAHLRPLPDLTDLDELLLRVRDAGLPVRYEVQGAHPDIPAGVQLTLYRLVQEALTNTMKHAGTGARATVTLHCAPDEVTVDVVDDGGTAPRPEPSNGTGRGLAGMRERVTAFGGDVRTGPDGDRGWRVRATMRLDEMATP